MKITKYEHSCVSVEENGATLIIDPVEFTSKLPEFTNVVAIIVTHIHGDHCQPEIINRIKATNPDAIVFTTVENTQNLPGSIAVEAGTVQDVAGLHLEFFGKDHAAIFDGHIPCSNVGVLINNVLAHPGDSFDMPPAKPTILLPAISAPWCKVQETTNYILNVRPQIVIPIHDAVLSQLGRTFNENNVKKGLANTGIQLISLNIADDFTI